MAKILIVDDDFQNRDLLKAFLGEAGHECAEATNGQEGLAAVIEKNPDLILLDVMMPKVDGLQVCRTLKKNPATQSIPIVILTALGQDIDEMRGFENGADEYLTKPLDFKRLSQVLLQFLPNESPSA
jgi:CheY-like chemotaxis protein